MAIDRYGNCGLCGVLIEEGLSIEPFGNCCQDCVDDVKQYGNTRVLSDSNCGACGQYFEQDQADAEGHHVAKYCDASEENN